MQVHRRRNGFAMTPTEDQEQAVLVQYMQLRHIPHWRTPNETFTKSWKQKAKNKRLGVVPGVPDLFVIVKNRLLAIEMKRTKGSTTSPAQIEWIKRLNECGVTARICKGADAAIAFIEEME